MTQVGSPGTRNRCSPPAGVGLGVGGQTERSEAVAPHAAHAIASTRVAAASRGPRGLVSLTLDSSEARWGAEA